MASPPKVQVAQSLRAWPRLAPEPVDPRVSQSEPDKIQTSEEAAWAMTAAGYTNIQNIVHEGRIWRADANNASGGNPVVLVCHGDDGRITLEAVKRKVDVSAG